MPFGPVAFSLAGRIAIVTGALAATGARIADFRAIRAVPSVDGGWLGRQGMR